MGRSAWSSRSAPRWRRCGQGTRWCCRPTCTAGSASTARAGCRAACLRVRPGGFGAAYGYAGMGPHRGGQAELLRVPFADANCVVVPGEPDELEGDLILLADAFITVTGQK